MAEPQKDVILNDVKLPIASPIVWRKITPFPAQFTTTSPQESDYTPTRKHRWSSLRGGLGKDKWSPLDNDRIAEGSVDTSQEMQTLPALVATMGKGAGVFGVEPVKIIKFKDRIWAIGHNQISYWTGSAWQSVKTDLPNPTDATVFYGTV